MRTAQQIYDAVQHAIGDTPDERLSLWDVINGAGRKIVTEYPWTWLTSEPTEIEATANQEWILLPDDFDRLLTIRVTGQGYYIAIARSLSEIEDMRGGPVSYAGAAYFIYPLMNHLKKGAPGGTPIRNRLEVYPTPTVTGTPSFTIVYMRQWVELNGDDASRELSIPAAFEDALLYRARADAKKLQFDEAAPVEEGMWQEEIARLKRHDGEQSIVRGVLRGGAGDRGGRRCQPIGFTDVIFT